MYLKKLRIHLKDLFVEIREEKQRLLKEIQLLKDFRNCLNSFVVCCKCDQNITNGNKFIAQQLENQYLTSFPTNLVIERPNLDKICQKLNKDEDIKIIDVFSEKIQPIDGFVEDEVIINDNILEMDCRQLSDDFLINENLADIDCREIPDSCLIKEIQLEVIPKEEVDPQLIDLEPEEPTIEQKYKDLELIMSRNKNVEEMNVQEQSVSIGTDPKISENHFSYLSSFVSQIKNCEEMNSITNFSANNVNKNSAKTIVVEKNKKIFGFVCNIENCTEFYKSITGLQSHIDRVHNRSQSVAKSPIKSSIKVVAKPVPKPIVKTPLTINELNSKTVRKSVKISTNLPKVLPKKQKTIRRKSDSRKDNEPNVVIKEPSIQVKVVPKNRLKNNSKYVCDEQKCGYSCGTKYQMLSHKISKHKNGRHFRCKRPDCRLMFKSKFDVIQHLRMHSIKSTENSNQSKSKGLELWFKCGFADCDLHFETRSQLKQHKIESNHIEVQKKTIEFKCSFKKCERVFKSQFALNTHLRRSKHNLKAKPVKKADHLDDKNLQKRKFECSLDNCGKIFTSRFALNQHIQKSDHKSAVIFNPSKKIFYSVKNPISRFFKCSNIDCKEVFKHRFALNQHSKTCQTKVEPSVSIKKLRCEIKGCKKQFTNYRSLKSHIKSFHKLPPLKCKLEECGFRFHTCEEKMSHFTQFHSSL